MIKAIIFDFDGLIIDTESVWYEAYKEAFKECNIELLLEEFVRCIGTNDDILSTIIREKTGRDTEIELIKKRAMALHSNKMENPVVREGVESYLQEAKEAGYSTAIASSSTFAWIDGFLKKLGIKDYFDFIVSRDDVEHVKPAPDLYNKSLEILGVSPDEAIIFEDSLNGLIAARAAGIACVIVPNPVTRALPFDGHFLKLDSMAAMPLAEVVKRLENK